MYVHGVRHLECTRLFKRLQDMFEVFMYYLLLSLLVCSLLFEFILVILYLRTSSTCVKVGTYETI